MFHFKNGRFHAYGVSFQFPEGFYLDTAPDMEYECGIVAWGPHEDYQVRWDFIDEYTKPQAVLLRFFDPEEGTEKISDVGPFVLGGLSGYRVIYRCGELEYFEARFSVEDDMQFILEIHADERKIMDVLALPEVQALLKDIRAE